MYAVIETGGKQYRVEVGTELEVELLEADAGSSVRIDRVLLVADGDTAAIGRPIVANATVAAEVIGRDRGPKTISFKYRPKARRRVKKGHRQELTHLRISDIVLDGHSAAADVAEAEAAHKRERTKLEEAARRQAAADAELAAKLKAEKPATSPSAAKAGPAKAPPTKAPSGSAAAKASKGGDGASRPTRPKAGAATGRPAKAASKAGAPAATPASGPAAKTTAAKPNPAKASAPKGTARSTKAGEAKSPAKRPTKKES